MKNAVERKTGHLAEPEKLFQAIFEQAAIGVALVSTSSGKFLKINKKYCDIVGYSEEEMLNMDFHSITYPEDHKSDFEIVELLKSGKIREFSKEKRYIRKNGDIVWVIGTVSPMWDPGKQPSYHITVIQDITRRKQVEEKLKEAILKAHNEKNKSEAIISALGDGLIIQDKDYKIIYQNKIQTEMYGEHNGELCYKVYEGRDTICEDCPVERTFSDGKIHRTERAVQIGSRISYFELISSPLMDPEGNIIAGIKIIRDMTEKRQAEEERIHLIAKEQSARAEAEAAKKLEKLKSIFIASTSHELRTPLNSIIGFSGVLLQGWSGELNQEQKEYLEMINFSSKHLLELIIDILDISKIESGSIDLKVSVFDLREVVDEAITTLQASIKEKGLEMSVEMEDIFMKSDRTRLLQCIMNLIGNSVKYTEKGSIKISAKITGNKVDISVTDTGIGIKTQDIPKLFAPFVRLESPLTLKTSGTGLGLYLTKKLARDVLGGEIYVTSKYGKGSTFTIQIPVEVETTRRIIKNKVDIQKHYNEPCKGIPGG